MKSNNIRICIRGCFNFLIILIIICINSTSKAGQSSELDTYILEKVISLTESISKDSDQLNSILEKKGFPPKWKVFYLFSSFSDYPEWPNIRKLETAYIMAELSKEGSGIKLLKDISFEIAIDHNIAISHENSLKIFFPKQEFTEELQNFKNKKYSFSSMSDSELDKTRSEINPHIRTLIEVISQYVSQIPGGLVIALNNCCSISEVDAYKILRKSETVQHVLEQALLKGKVPKSILERLNILFALAERNNIAIKAEKDDINKKLELIKIDFIKEAGTLLLKDYNILRRVERWIILSEAESDSPRLRKKVDPDELNKIKNKEFKSWDYKQNEVNKLVSKKELYMLRNEVLETANWNLVKEYEKRYFLDLFSEEITINELHENGKYNLVSISNFLSNYNEKFGPFESANLLIEDIKDKKFTEELKMMFNDNGIEFDERKIETPYSILILGLQNSLKHLNRSNIEFSTTVRNRANDKSRARMVRVPTLRTVVRIR